MLLDVIVVVSELEFVCGVVMVSSVVVVGLARMLGPGHFRSVLSKQPLIYLQSVLFIFAWRVHPTCY